MSGAAGAVSKRDVDMARRVSAAAIAAVLATNREDAEAQATWEDALKKKGAGGARPGGQEDTGCHGPHQAGADRS